MRQDVLFALRQMMRQPGLSSAAVLTLGLGLGASITVFTLVNALLLAPLPYPSPDRLMAIDRGGPGSRQAHSHRDVDFLREVVRTCGRIAATVSGSGLNTTVAGITSYEQDRLVSQQYFAALGVEPRWGRGFTADEDTAETAPVVVLNERFVRRQGLAPEALIGRSLELGGRTHTIVGVLAADHTRPSDADIYRPLGRDPRGDGLNLSVVCRLRDDASGAALNAELAGLLEEGRRRKLFGSRATHAYSATPRHEWEFGTLRAPLQTLLMAVALVLLAAAANTTGLLLVRASARRREMAVRTALGATPGRIARALVVEGLVLSALAGLLGLAAAPLLVQGLLAVAPPYYADLATFELDATVVSVAVLLCAVVGLTTAVPPLLEVMRVNLRDTLHEEGRGGSPGRRTLWLRHLLIGAETAVSAVLLVGALLLLQTFMNLMNVDTGIDSRHVVTGRMSIQGPRYDDTDMLVRFFEEGVRRLEAAPGIASAAIGASLPAERALNLPAVFVDLAEQPREPIVNWRYVTPSYFPLLRMRTLAGRPLADTDGRSAPLVAVVNETFARQHYGSVESALGRRIAVQKNPAREVVGVVSDTSGWSLADRPRPLMFVPLAQAETSALRTAHQYFPPRWIVRASRDPADGRRALEGVVRDLDPAQPFIEIETLDAMMTRSVGLQRFYLVALAAFALFAVLLAAVGIHAAYAYAIASRVTEIGVRLALGAAPRRILVGIVARALLLGAAATTVGLAAAAAGTRVLRSVLFEVSTSDPGTYAVVALVLLGTVAAATLAPAVRAARVDPMVALKR